MSDDNRYQSLGRSLTLLADLIKGGFHDRESAARRLGLGLAAADRQLLALQRFVPGIEVSTENRKRTLRFNANQGAAKLSPHGMVVSYFGMSLARLFQGSVYESATAEVIDCLLKRTRKPDLFRDSERKFYYHRQGGEMCLPEAAKILQCLIDSIMRCRTVSLRYHNMQGVPIDRIVNPLTLTIYSHHLYLVATPKEGTTLEPHPYRVSRIMSAEQTESKFKYPSKAEYDPDQLFRDSLGIFIGGVYKVEDVKIRLSKHWRRLAENYRWHNTQKIQDDGAHIYLTYHVRICPEFEAWILSLGDYAQVLHPVWLREKIAKRLADAASNYREVKSD